jgi:dTDP-glucose 4,6-dehydratase
MPTSVVTGGAGFLGSHLCDYLVEHGHRVVCVDNLETGSLENIDHLRGDAFSFIYHDVVEPIAVDEPVDYVFHLAALASPVDYLRAPLKSLKVGSYGTHNALGLAKWKRARFLISSTSEVYGDPQVHPQPETYWGNVNPIGPRGVYDEAKRYAEAMTMTYHQQQGVDTTIARKNPRIDMMLWFLLKDDPNLNGWQSGLITTRGAQKPEFAAFTKMAAPLAGH